MILFKNLPSRWLWLVAAWPWLGHAGGHEGHMTHVSATLHVMPGLVCATAAPV
jgi:hypothetical protein